MPTNTLIPLNAINYHQHYVVEAIVFPYHSFDTDIERFKALGLHKGATVSLYYKSKSCNFIFTFNSTHRIALGYKEAAQIQVYPLE